MIPLKTLIFFVYSKINYLIITFIIVYTLAAAIVSVNRYWQYQTFYFDLGIFDSAIWEVSRFQLPYVDHVDFGDKKILILGDHFNPSIFLLSPLYWFTNRTEIILIAQSVSVGVAGFVAFCIARKKLKNKLAVAALVTAFLGYVGLQNALISDFHEATVAVLPLTLIFWALINQKWKLYFLLLIILLGFKEVFAGLGIGIGMYLILKRERNIKLGLVTIFISLIWAILTIKFIIPFLSGGTYLYTPQNLPTNLVELINRFIYPLLTVKTIFLTYWSFGLLPIFDLSVFPAIFENFFERFVLSHGKGNDLGMHYNATLSPLLFMGALATFEYMERHNLFRKIVNIYAILIILNVFLLHRFILRGPLGLVYNPIFYEQNHKVKYVDNLVKNFPKEGLVMAQNDLAVRFTHQGVVLLRQHYKTIDPDYVIINLTAGQNGNSFFPLNYEKAEILKEELLKDPNYLLKKYANDLYSFEKVKN